jgi:hypothetical protein
MTANNTLNETLSKKTFNGTYFVSLLHKTRPNIEKVKSLIQAQREIIIHIVLLIIQNQSTI